MAKAGAKKARTSKTTSPNGSQTATAVTASAQPINITDLQEQIRRRAYELYEQRGRQHGFDAEDWFQAESEMRSRTA